MSTPAAPLGDAPDLLHVQVHHVPRAAGGDLLRSLAQVLTRGREVWQPGDAQPVQPPAHRSEAHPVALGDEVVMDAPCGPLALPPQGVDLGDQDRIELGR